MPHHFIAHAVKHLVGAGTHHVATHDAGSAHHAAGHVVAAHHATANATAAATSASAVQLSSINQVLAAVIAGGSIARLITLMLSPEECKVVNHAIKVIPDSDAVQLLEAVSQSAEATAVMARSTEDTIHNIGHLASLIRGKRL